MATPFDTTAPAPVESATDGQIGFISSLLAERVWNDAKALPEKHISRAAVLNLVIGWAMDPTAAQVTDELRTVLSDADKLGTRVNNVLAHCLPSAVAGAEFVWLPLTKKGASALIEWLKDLPVKAGSAGIRVERALDRMDAEAKMDAPAPVQGTDRYADRVPAGRYALDTMVHAVNGTAFYKVDRPTEGKWAGRVFVKQLVGPEEQRLSQKQGLGILSRIAEVGAEAASARYGHEIGECGICGRRLTNDESRERGIGPICAAKMGW